MMMSFLSSGVNLCARFLGHTIGKCLSPGCIIPERQAICILQQCDQAALLVLCVCAGMHSLTAGVVLSVFKGPICPAALCLQSILHSVGECAPHAGLLNLSGSNRLWGSSAVLGISHRDSHLLLSCPGILVKCVFTFDPLLKLLSFEARSHIA